MRTRLMVLLSFALFVGSGPTTASAEPLVITSGSLSLLALSGQEMVLVALLPRAGRLFVNANAEDGPGFFTHGAVPRGTRAGETFDLSSSILLGGAVNHAELDHRMVTVRGSLRLTGANVVWKSNVSGFDELDAGPGAFTLAGPIEVLDFISGDHLFSGELTGSGLASALFCGSSLQIGYTFSDTAPVPEPGTLLLFTTGIAAAIKRAAWKVSKSTM